MSRSFLTLEPSMITELAAERLRVVKAAKTREIPRSARNDEFAHSGARRSYTSRVVKILLLSTYELGRQPFGLASPAAWLRNRGHAVRCFDLSRQSLEESAVREAELIVFYLPMHTATRLAMQWVPTIRAQNPDAHLMRLRTLRAAQ